MAASSIFAPIIIEGESAGKAFADALENSYNEALNNPHKKSVLRKPAVYVKKGEIKEIFKTVKK